MTQILNRERMDNAVPNFGFINIFGESTMIVEDVFNKDGGTYVKVRFKPTSGANEFKGILSDEAIATDPKFKDFLEEADGGYRFKDGTTCHGTKEGLRFALA